MSSSSKVSQPIMTFYVFYKIGGDSCSLMGKTAVKNDGPLKPRKRLPQIPRYAMGAINYEFPCLTPGFCGSLVSVCSSRNSETCF